MAAELVRPILTVDIVLLTISDGELRVVLQKRDRQPHSSRPALIGGYVHPGEDPSTLAAAVRVLGDKAKVQSRFIDQLMTFSGSDRDPRGWSASVAYYALAPIESIPVSNPSLTLLSLSKAKGLPFDHDEIVAKAIERWKRRSAYSSLPAFLLGEAFTLPALRMAYEKMLGRALNDSAFRRKIDELRIIKPITGGISKATARPAQLYQLSNPRLTEFERTL
jgi:ADP-ribose pyrophosphatase YjhB (NUDIX family)